MGRHRARGIHAGGAFEPIFYDIKARPKSKIPKAVLPLAPVDETIPPIPHMEGTAKKRFEQIQKEAFTITIEQEYYLISRDRKPGKQGTDFNAFTAFAAYYSKKLKFLPASTSYKLLARVWSVYPHRFCWKAYAKTYKAFQREIPFTEWLKTTPKTSNLESLTSTTDPAKI